MLKLFQGRNPWECVFLLKFCRSYWKSKLYHPKLEFLAVAKCWKLKQPIIPLKRAVFMFILLQISEPSTNPLFTNAMFVQVIFQLGFNPNQILKLCVDRTFYQIKVIKALLMNNLFITWSEQKRCNFQLYFTLLLVSEVVSALDIEYRSPDTEHWTYSINNYKNR